MPNDDKGRKKKSNIRTSPCPSKTEITLLLPQRNYTETFQATHLVKWSLTAQPPHHALLPSPSLSEQKKFINGFSYINTIEKKEVWNLNYNGTKGTLAPWEFVRKCEPPQEAEALPPFSSLPFPCATHQEKSVHVPPNLQQKIPIPSPKHKKTFMPLE